ncbi:MULTISPECIES: hypothetical protein [Aestuariivivens]|uniref:hypothetical protein n=1 Tax=Aestuariivivens TaxID=1820275 RepID=UPI001CBCD0E7|nr:MULTISPECIES: hypothetical protein [Aestuariivivens]
MNKSVKTILLVAGLGLLVYGIYTLIAPEASVSIGDFSVEAQDNTDAYITIALGLVAIVLSLVAGKKVD